MFQSSDDRLRLMTKGCLLSINRRMRQLFCGLYMSERDCFRALKYSQRLLRSALVAIVPFLESLARKRRSEREVSLYRIPVEQVSSPINSTYNLEKEYRIFISEALFL